MGTMPKVTRGGGGGLLKKKGHIIRMEKEWIKCNRKTNEDLKTLRWMEGVDQGDHGADKGQGATGRRTNT